MADTGFDQGLAVMPRRSYGRTWSTEPDEHRSPGRIANVAYRPVAALAPPVGEVMATDRLGLTGEAARQFGSVAGHHANPRALRLCCVKADERSCDDAQSQRRNITLGAT